MCLIYSIVKLCKSYTNIMSVITVYYLVQSTDFRLESENSSDEARVQRKINRPSGFKNAECLLY